MRRFFSCQTGRPSENLYQQELPFPDGNLRFPAGQHFGGDEALALDFMNVMAGGRAKSSLEAGLRSAAVCLAAREADAASGFIPVRY